MTEANSLNAATTGIVGNTGTSFTGTAVSQYNVLVGGATSSTVANIAPSATTGAAFISAGNAANPAYSSTFSVVDASNYTNLSASSSGGIVESRITNSSNTGSSSARINISNGGASGGDAYTLYQTDASSTDTWETGVKASDGSWNLNQGVTAATANLSGTNVIAATTAGVLTLPLQIAFYSYLTSSVNNTTGNGAIWQLGTTTALTILYQQGSSMNTNGTFTAPVAGWYLFTYSFSTTNLASGMNVGTGALLPSGLGTYIYGIQNDPGILRGGSTSNNVSLAGTSILKLAVNDTVTCNLQISNGAGNTATVVGGEGQTYFSGIKIA